ncbi:MAG TPA: hypothetical protein VMX11_10165, partial [Actinomycetes bacterium]|nr:hypothetical protein [Actinomycetes bacterium]
MADFTALFGAEGEDLSAAAGPVGNPFDRLLAGEPVDDAELVAPPPPVFDPITTSVRNFASGALHLGRLAASGENRIELFQSFARNGPVGPLGDGLLALMGREPDPDKVDIAVKADLEALIPVLDGLAKDLHTKGNFLTEKVMQGLGSLVGAPVMLQALNQEAFEEAKARGMTDAEATRRGNLNMIIGGAMEMIGLHGMFRARGVFKALARVKDPFTRKAFVAGLAITEAAGREGLTETGQQTLLEVMALYDGTDDSLADMAKRIVESGLIGFAVGGIGGGVFGGIGLIESELMQVDADAAHTAEVLRIEMQKQVLLKQIEESRAREQAKITPPEEGDIEAVMAELFTAPRRTAPAERPAPTTQRDDGTHSKLPKFIPEMDIPNGLRDRGDGDRYFEPDDLARLRGTRHKDREILVYMSPDDFLALAPPIAQAGEQKGGEPVLDKIFKIGERIGSGEPLADIPFLLGETKDGLFKVSGHEGRHRALMLRAAGVTQMPVRITDANIRWSEQTDPKNRDFTEDFPTVMEGQLGNFPQETHAPKGQGGVNFRTFPFTREDIVTPIVADADEMPLTPDEENALSEDVGFDPADFMGVEVSDVAPRNVRGLPKSALTPAQQRVVAQLVVDENVELPEAVISGDVTAADSTITVGEDVYRVVQGQKGRRLNYKLFRGTDLLGQAFNLKEAVRMAQLTSAVGVTPKPFDPRTIRKLSDQGLVTAVEGKVRLTELGKRTADNFRRDSRADTLEERTGFDREIEERRGLQRGDRVVLDELTEAVFLRGETTVGETNATQDTAVIRQLTPEGVADSVVRLQRIRRAFEEDYRPDGVFAQTGGFSPDEIVALAENLADAYDVTGFTPGEPPPPMDYHPPTGPTVPGSPPPPTIQGRFDLLQADGNGGTDVAATPPGGQFPPTTPPPPGGRGPYRQWPPPPPPGGRKPLEHIIPFTTFDVAEWRTWDAFVANFQNRMIRLRQFQETIRETVPNRAATGKKKTEGTIPIRQVGFGLREEMDTYLHETLFPGKSTERMEAFENELVFPAMRQMTQEGVSLESMGEFMFARHAPERNRKLRFVAGEKQLIEEKAAIETEIVTLTSEGQRILRQADEIQGTEQGPFDRRAQASAKAAVMRLRKKAEAILAKRKKLQKQAADLQVRIDTEFPDGMSGMTDPEAQNIITRHRVAGTYEVHEKWRLFWKERVIDERLSMIEEEKLETPQFVQALRDAFEDDTYIPLYVVDEEITTRQKNIGAGPVSRGYTVPGREARRLKGGNVKNRYNPLAAIIMDFERTITRSEKTRVLRSFAKMVRANRNDATWIIRRPEPRDGQVVEPSNVIDPDTAPASAQGSFIPGFGDIGRADKTEGIKGFREGDEIILPDGRRIDATTVWFDQATGEPFGWHPSLDLSGDNVVVFA